MAIDPPGLRITFEPQACNKQGSKLVKGIIFPFLCIKQIGHEGDCDGTPIHLQRTATGGIATIEIHKFDELLKQQCADDRVNHPSHYGGGDNPYEAIKIIEAWGLNFSLGNAVKYIIRAGQKEGADEVEDLRKAKWYVNRELEQSIARAGRNAERSHEASDQERSGTRSEGN